MEDSPSEKYVFFKEINMKARCDTSTESTTQVFTYCRPKKPCDTCFPFPRRIGFSFDATAIKIF